MPLWTWPCPRWAMWVENPIGAGTASPTMWNGAPALSAGVPTSAAIWTAEPTPNSPAASLECSGSSNVASGWTAPQNQSPECSSSSTGHQRTKCRTMWALWKRWRMEWFILWRAIQGICVGRSNILLEVALFWDMGCRQAENSADQIPCI